MKKLWIILALIVSFMLFTGGSCDEKVSTADKKQTEATKKAMAEADRQIGMPIVAELCKIADFFELRDKEDLICFAYLKNEYSGKLVFLGKCVGYGLPYSVQYTNPEYIANVYGNGGGAAILPQPDPNGLFMPEGLSATWLMLIDPKTGKARPTYVEPEIVVAPFPLH